MDYEFELRNYPRLEGKDIVLSMGCRERTRGAIAIPGDRPAGIFTSPGPPTGTSRTPSAS